MNKLLPILLISLLFLISCSNDDLTSSAVLDTFTQCLTERGAKMYGAYWCPHCLDQKEMFGKNWNNINYIECSLPGKSGQTEVCNLAGITSYPTWEFSDGSRRNGVLQLEELGSITGCPLYEELDYQG